MPGHAPCAFGPHVVTPLRVHAPAARPRHAPARRAARAGAARRQGAPRLQRLGRARDHGGLRPALHAAQLSQLERNARGQHRLRRGLLPHPRSGGGHAARAVRLPQCRARHPRHRADHLPGRPADQRLRRAPRARHGPAHARRGLRLHRLDDHLAHLRELHLHLLRAGSGGDGLCAGARLRHPARLGLPDLRGGGDPARHARGHGHQPAAGVDAAAVARDAGRAVCLRLLAQPGRARRDRPLRWRAGGRGRRHGVQRLPLRRGDDGGHRAHDADGRAGRLPALHAREDGKEPAPLVGRRADRRAGLGGAGGLQDAGRHAARLPRDQPLGAHRPCGRSQPDVPRGLRVRLLAPGLGGGRDHGVRGDLAAQDQRHQRLRRLARVEQLLRAPHPQPPGPRGVGGVQHRHRPDADGARCLPRARRGAGAVLQHRHLLDHGRRRRPGDQQAARPLAAGHRVQARAPL